MIRRPSAPEAGVTGPGISRRAALRLGLTAALAAVAPLPARAAACQATRPDLEGPFYVPGAPARAAIAAPDEPGQRLIVRGRVLGPDCATPLGGALLDIWQADARGSYHGQDQQYRLRGRLRTGPSGLYELSTIVPGRYRFGGRFRPAHIHFTITHPAMAPLTTQLYFRGDPYLAPNDACGEACHSDDPERVIELRKEEIMGGEILTGRFEIVLASRAPDVRSR